MKVYIIIDEYDNFANTLLTTSGTVEYHKLTHGEGFFKVFFNVLKGGTTGMDAPISRLFMTGVKIPNETVKRLYYDYIKEAYDETGTFALDIFEYDRFMRQAAYRGEWKPLFDYITGLMRESMSLRDLITGEKSIQAFLNVYLGLSNLYIIHTVNEYNKGYADIFMEPFTARYGEIKYSYLLEIKYLSKTESNKPATKENIIKQLAEDAEQQLKNYALDQKLIRSVETTSLIKLVLVFRGTELEYISHVT